MAVRGATQCRHAGHVSEPILALMKHMDAVVSASPEFTEHCRNLSQVDYGEHMQLRREYDRLTRMYDMAVCSRTYLETVNTELSKRNTMLEHQLLGYISTHDNDDNDVFWLLITLMKDRLIRARDISKSVEHDDGKRIMNPYKTASIPEKPDYDHEMLGRALSAVESALERNDHLKTIATMNSENISLTARFKSATEELNRRKESDIYGPAIMLNCQRNRADKYHSLYKIAMYQESQFCKQLAEQKTEIEQQTAEIERQKTKIERQKTKIGRQKTEIEMVHARLRDIKSSYSKIVEESKIMRGQTSRRLKDNTELVQEKNLLATELDAIKLEAKDLRTYCKDLRRKTVCMDSRYCDSQSDKPQGSSGASSGKTELNANDTRTPDGVFLQPINADTTDDERGNSNEYLRSLLAMVSELDSV